MTMRSEFATWAAYAISLGTIWYFVKKKAEKAKYDTSEAVEENGLDPGSLAYNLDAYWAGHLPPECEEFIDMIRFPNVFRRYGSKIPKGLLLYGDPGTGKTYFGKMLANIVNAHFFYAAASQMDEIYLGSGPKKIRALFDKAKKAAENGEVEKSSSGWFNQSEGGILEDIDNLKVENSFKNKKISIIFLDEIDAFGNRESVYSDSRHATLSQLLTCMDGIQRYDNVIVIGATNYLNAVDSALTRSGRFDRIIKMTLPDKLSRRDLLAFYLKEVPDIKLEQWNDLLDILSEATEGFNCSDLRLVVNEATLRATRETVGKLKGRINTQLNKKGYLPEEGELSTQDIDELIVTPLSQEDLIGAFLSVYNKILLESKSAKLCNRRPLLAPAKLKRIHQMLNTN